ncbi:phosphatase PAP2 family protein [Corallococcus exiguus]|uniref:phosphatase PAP2 family protein n=1 Tax=Corallococcus TaxID=83461 RepID=UPI000EDBDECC|nr:MULTISPECIES: phosphatase PAP2 family protein [Corallococcus]NNB89971.1 phosphatase PAP2 family protein [Corallococcus exiguus]NNB97666.1 phosphatase PAP2 family protein [Corallococcus exiguus]NNC06679.1 phosphatase PAP2 family protein [Corallococcus exiguus]NPC50414.1 phosphatase PAP2 family protein [Corallococcus exiguus]RKH83801.1 phosphatase PAP2 family protein [Corallococcus sp. AB032C]
MLASYRTLATFCLLVLAPLTPAAAQDASDAPRALRFNWTRDGIITGTAGVLWISSESVFKANLAPAQCRWCDRAPDGTDRLNRLDRWGRGIAGNTEASRKRADTWSNIIGFAGLPLGLLGTQYAVGRSSGASTEFFAQDATIMVQSAVLASVANQAVKFAVGRERPFVHVLPEGEKGLTAHPSDNNLSFYSGHTNLAFSLAVSAGTVATMRGYKHQAIVWGVGLPLAASVGLLRMGADKHYLSDVITGAVLGTAFGVAVPLLLHGRVDDTPPTRARASSVSLNPMVGTQMVGLSGAF